MSRKTERLYDAVCKYNNIEEEMRIKACEQYEAIEIARRAIEYFEEQMKTARRKKKNAKKTLERIQNNEKNGAVPTTAEIMRDYPPPSPNKQTF